MPGPIAPSAKVVVENPGLNRERFSQAMKEASQTSALVFFTLTGAMIFARFLVPTGLPSEFVDAVQEASIPTMLIMILFLVMYVFLECSRTPYQ